MNTRVIAAAVVLSTLTACGRTELAVQPAPAALTALGQPTATSSAKNLQISGTAVFVGVGGSICPGPPAGYTNFLDYPPLLLSGSLQGCWYTKIDSFKETPSGVYLETGREVFVGSLNGAKSGVFTTTYKFEGKYDPYVSTGMGVEVRGRCQHPLVAGSGTGGFAGATGRIDFKDIVADGSYIYRGHISTR